MTSTGLTRAFAVAAAGVVALTACETPDDTNGNGEDIAGGDLTLATGSTGGTYYPLGGEIANLWTESLEDVSVSTQATGASVDNMYLLDSGENELVMAVNGTAQNAVAGAGDFGDEPLDDPDAVRAIGNVYPEVMQVTTVEDSGVESIEDLDGARVELGPPGSATEVLAQQILDAYDVEPSETFDSAFGDAATNLGDGQVDAAFGVLGVPDASLTEIATTNDIHMLDIEGDALDEVLAADDSLVPHEIPAGTYEGQDDPHHTVTNWATLYGPSNLSDDLVYDLVSTMYGQADDLEHDVAGEIQLDTAVEGLGDIELHPGAEQYYEEEGALD
ncbi:TAXI family TRAP transporter solute-binding subunit [Lipingzhangella sp. LS1_29]|uniref:TAXI family TRAP transporter solute-binding subunit n=1 Tax=Lipingzhangella rawalii TaxID=2055835 RepID=A0ABU2H8P5_9ACTN|nr:TAXI family TRAP transporter solute-binding subunit [Lipingzhangella rawalii]MDS1271676.1 TAXI family TRAP transporter solute-binding subunit [Lipingzhangella rawalii]